jgi:hypothetical protein
MSESVSENEKAKRNLSRSNYTMCRNQVIMVNNKEDISHNINRQEVPQEHWDEFTACMKQNGSGARRTKRRRMKRKSLKKGGNKNKSMRRKSTKRRRRIYNKSGK